MAQSVARWGSASPEWAPEDYAFQGWCDMDVNTSIFDGDDGIASRCTVDDDVFSVVSPCTDQDGTGVGSSRSTGVESVDSRRFNSINSRLCGVALTSRSSLATERDPANAHENPFVVGGLCFLHVYHEGRSEAIQGANDLREGVPICRERPTQRAPRGATKRTPGGSAGHCPSPTDVAQNHLTAPFCCARGLPGVATNSASGHPQQNLPISGPVAQFAPQPVPGVSGRPQQNLPMSGLAAQTMPQPLLGPMTQSQPCLVPMPAGFMGQDMGQVPGQGFVVLMPVQQSPAGFPGQQPGQVAGPGYGGAFGATAQGRLATLMQPLAGTPEQRNPCAATPFPDSYPCESPRPQSRPAMAQRDGHLGPGPVKTDVGGHGWVHIRGARQSQPAAAEPHGQSQPYEQSGPAQCGVHGPSFLAGEGPASGPAPLWSEAKRPLRTSSSKNSRCAETQTQTRRARFDSWGGAKDSPQHPSTPARGGAKDAPQTIRGRVAAETPKIHTFCSPGQECVELTPGCWTFLDEPQLSLAGVETRDLGVQQALAGTEGCGPVLANQLKFQGATASLRLSWDFSRLGPQRSFRGFALAFLPPRWGTRPHDNILALEQLLRDPDVVRTGCEGPVPLLPPSASVARDDPFVFVMRRLPNRDGEWHLRDGRLSKYALRASSWLADEQVLQVQGDGCRGDALELGLACHDDASGARWLELQCGDRAIQVKLPTGSSLSRLALAPLAPQAQAGIPGDSAACPAPQQGTWYCELLLERLLRPAF